MSAANLTDEDIQVICFGKPYAREMAADLYAQRFKDQATEAHLRDKVEKACSDYEAEQTDAFTTAEQLQSAFPPHARAFPTPEQLQNVNRKVGLSLAVAGDAAAGKTSLLIFLLEAMADAGLLDEAATKAITINPARYISTTRSTNDQHVEVIDIDLDLDALLVESGIVDAIVNAPQIAEFDFYVDAALLDRFGWKSEVWLAMNHILEHPRLDEADEINVTFRKA